jgi:membrane associated rhomboid family serine protease
MFKNSRNYMPTYILVAANIAVYAFTSYLSGNAIEMSDQALLQFGQYNPYVIYNGEVWRLLTGMFVHANIAHIVGNMLFLFIYGLRAEDMFDIKEYLLIYFMSGLAGGLLTLLLWPTTLSVGASGAIFGMIGATMIYLRRAIGQSIISALLFAFLLFAFNFGPNVNYLAHLGGLAVGLIIGYFLAATRKPRQQVSYHFSYPSSYGH